MHRYKAHIVVKGFHQVPRFDVTETFKPVVKPTIILIILSFALPNKWDIRQLDVNNAFSNGDLQKEVWNSSNSSLGPKYQGDLNGGQPPGFEIDQNPALVCKLHKALYGLWQARNSITCLLVYVDDILIIGNDKTTIHTIIQQLHNSFPLKCQFLHWYSSHSITWWWLPSLPMEIHCWPPNLSENAVWSKRQYVMKSRYKMTAYGSDPVCCPALAKCIWWSPVCYYH